MYGINTYEDLREAMPTELPWAIREALIGNVVVGNYTPEISLRLASTIDKHLRESAQMTFDFGKHITHNKKKSKHLKLPVKGFKRMTGQTLLIFEFMKDGNWHTLAEISEATGAPETSVSACLREFRKKRLGSHTVDLRKSHGVWKYKLIINFGD